MENTIKKRNLPKEVFLHLLATVTLYWSAVTFITLLFQYINYFVPDVLYQRYGYLAVNPAMRFAISSLIIVFPVFLFISRLLYKSYIQNTEKREFKLRKWLLYFTIFVAALIIIGDLVIVINSFLGGEITLKFILRALSVLLVAGVIFGYYLDDVRRERPSKNTKYFAWTASAVILIAVVGSFFIIGSPKAARLVQLDQQKISDLQGIQAEIVNYWQRKETLPGSLSVLTDPISGYKVPTDPQSGASYEYNIKNAANLSFELCAVFNREGNDQYYNQSVPMSTGSSPQNWQHGVGRVCFERTIDKQLYPLLNKTAK